MPASARHFALVQMVTAAVVLLAGIVGYAALWLAESISGPRPRVIDGRIGGLARPETLCRYRCDPDDCEDCARYQLRPGGGAPRS